MEENLNIITIPKIVLYYDTDYNIYKKGILNNLPVLKNGDDFELHIYTASSETFATSMIVKFIKGDGQLVENEILFKGTSVIVNGTTFQYFYKTFSHETTILTVNDLQSKARLVVSPLMVDANSTQRPLEAISCKCKFGFGDLNMTTITDETDTNQLITQLTSNVNTILEISGGDSSLVYLGDELPDGSAIYKTWYDTSNATETTNNVLKSTPVLKSVSPTTTTTNTTTTTTNDTIIVGNNNNATNDNIVVINNTNNIVVTCNN